MAKDEYEDDDYFEDDDEEVYSSEGREHLVDDDEISPWEAAFMEGADDEGKNAKCRNCGKPLVRERRVIEKAIKDKLYRFCSEECLDEFESRKH